MARKKFYQSLYLQVIMGILIGALLGHFYPEVGAAMKPLGDGFIKLINLIGNGVATVVVAKWRQELDEARMRERLARETSAKAEEPETLVA
jgi:Na+/H+-dicarboxylate symporter